MPWLGQPCPVSRARDVQEPDQRPNGALRHAVDPADGGGHRPTQSHLSLWRLRPLLGIPHRTGSAAPIPRCLERRSKVATPKSKTLYCFLILSVLIRVHPWPIPET